MSAADVVERVTHAITQSAISAKVTAHPARIVVEVADPVRRDRVTTAYRSLIQETQDSPAVLGALSIVGEGLLQLTTVAAD